MERNDYQVEKAVHYEGLGEWNSIELKRSVTKGIKVVGRSYVRSCAANPNDSKQPRDKEWYLDNIIRPMVESGEIDDGSKTPFDDRKLRYASSFIPGRHSWKNLEVSFGITHYKAFLEDQNRNDDENLALQARGVEEFGDRYAFFSRAPGIAVVPLFKAEDGSNVAYVGERTNAEATGFLNAVAGHLAYRENPEDVNLMEDLKREMSEEFGVEAGSIVGEPVFVGVYSNPIKGDLDFTFLAQTDVPASYVDSGEWMSRVKEWEHKPLVKLATIADVRKLTEQGALPDGRGLPLMYSTRGALESITEAELRGQ
jgi:8-oxo-dGTP pyrophosphatase MutT (NUDIX family)